MNATDAKVTDMQLVVFRLGNEEFGADISQVREIIRAGEITSIPQAPADILGVINLRGQITTVVNLRKHMGMADMKTDGNSRIIVVEVDKRTVGLMVDSVAEVKYVNASQIEPISKLLVDDVEHSSIFGVCKLKDHLLLLMDMRQLLSGLVDAKAASAADATLAH